MGESDGRVPHEPPAPSGHGRRPAAGRHRSARTIPTATDWPPAASFERLDGHSTRSQKRHDPGWLPRVGHYERSLRCDRRVSPAPDGFQPPWRNNIWRSLHVSDAARALEIEALAGERFAAVGQTVLAALAESGLSGRRVANVVSWFIVAQLALGPWRDRGEVRPAELARAMGVSRWTEWRTRLDAARAGLVRDWTLPDPEARGYGRGAVRVLELAFVRTRQVTQRVAANREEKASRAERRREARRRAKEASRAGDAGDRRRAAGDAERAGEARGADLARRGAALGDAPPGPARSGAGRPGAPALASTAGVVAARAAVPEVEWSASRIRAGRTTHATGESPLRPRRRAPIRALPTPSSRLRRAPLVRPGLRRCNSRSPAAPTGARASARDRGDRLWDPAISHAPEAPTEPEEKSAGRSGRWPTGAEDQSR